MHTAQLAREDKLRLHFALVEGAAGSLPELPLVLGGFQEHIRIALRIYQSYFKCGHVKRKLG